MTEQEAAESQEQETQPTAAVQESKHKGGNKEAGAPPSGGARGRQGEEGGKMGCGASSQAAVAGPHPSTTNSHHKGHQSGPEYQIDDWEGQNSGTRVEAAQVPRSPSHSHQSVTSTTSQSHHTTIAFGIVTNSIGSLVRNRIKGDVDAKAKPKDNENARQKTEKEIDEEREQVQAHRNGDCPVKNSIRTYLNNK
jgi:hypothetical protein